MKLGLVPSLVAGTTLAVAAGAGVVLMNNEPATDEQPALEVNVEARDALVAKGVPTAAADFFSKTRVEPVEASPLSVSWREIYADGSVRTMTLTYVPEKRYDLAPAEVAVAREKGASTYRPQYAHAEEGVATKTRLQFFVPYESMSRELSDRVRPPGRGSVPAGDGRRTAMQQQSPGVGADVIVEGLLQESTLQSAGQGAELISKAGEAIQSTRIQNVGGYLGVAVAGIDAANDIAGAWDLRLEYLALMTELARLKRCADNPTSNNVPVPPEERARTREYVERLESDIRSMTGARYLNQVADSPLNLAATANPVVGSAVAAAFSVMVKPFATWSEETLKQAIQNRMEAARQAVPFCDETCESRQAPPPAIAPFPAPQNFTPGAIPPSPAGPGPTCVGGATAKVTYSYIDRGFGGDVSRDHFVSYTAVAKLTNVVDVGPLKYRERDYSGTGTGRYRETESHIGAGCSRNIEVTGDATMDVRVQTVDFELDPQTGQPRVTAVLAEVNVQVKTTNAVRRQTGGCPAGHTFTYSAVGDGPIYTIGCNFYDVDLQRGGLYKSDDDQTDYADNDEERNIDCTLDLGPLKFEMPPLAQGAPNGSAQSGRPGGP